MHLARSTRLGLIGCALLVAACSSDVTSFDGRDVDGPTGRVSSALANPVIVSLDKSSGTAGTEVTITGSGFGATKTSTSSVNFRGNFAPILSWSDTTIVCTVPPSATAGDLTVWVTVGGVESAKLPFTIVPSVASVVPTYAAPGETVTLDGANFGTTQRTSTVTIGGVPATVSSWSMRSISVTVPAVSGTVDVVVTVNGYASAPKQLSTDPPTPPPSNTHVPGREVVYAWMDTGSVSHADKILTDVWPLDRFPDATLPADLTWTENPYSDGYWRAQFYGFRALRHLLAAYRSTGNVAYKNKLLAVIQDFADSGQTSSFSRDRFATANRGLILVNVYWKLQAASALTPSEAETLVALLDTTARFLADPNNYDANDDRGLTESAALLAIATNFPTLGDAASWTATAEARLSTFVDDAVDSEGAPRSRAVHTQFQMMGSLWEIAKWARTHAAPTGAVLDTAIARMATPAAYLLQPDGKIPLVGQSPAWDVRASASSFAEIAQAYPAFDYALSAGASGAAPGSRVLDLTTSGWSVMRSGWTSGAGFTGDSHVFFDWRTTTSSKADYDLLNVTVYDSGRPLVVDSGMYSTGTSTAVEAYFKSTAAHNTVLVDGQSQPLGVAQAGAVAQLVNLHHGDTNAFARTASHAAYAGVLHSRAVALLHKGVVMVVDRLQSASSHTYEQVWHLTPEATQLASSTGTKTGPVVRGLTSGGTPLVRIASRFTFADDSMSYDPEVTTARGSDAPVDGWVSESSGARSAGYAVRFKAQGTTVVFVTLITSGAAVSDEPELYAWADPDWSQGYVWSNAGAVFLDRWLDIENDAAGHGFGAYLNDGP